VPNFSDRQNGIASGGPLIPADRKPDDQDPKNALFIKIALEEGLIDCNPVAAVRQIRTEYRKKGSG